MSFYRTNKKRGGERRSMEGKKGGWEEKRRCCSEELEKGEEDVGGKCHEMSEEPAGRREAD